MNAIKYIRTKVFKIGNQVDFAATVSVAQSTVSRWERGRPLSMVEMRKIRQAAIDRGIKWKDVWFFEVPELTGVTG